MPPSRDEKDAELSIETCEERSIYIAYEKAVAVCVASSSKNGG